MLHNLLEAANAPLKKKKESNKKQRRIKKLSISQYLSLFFKNDMCEEDGFKESKWSTCPTPFASYLF